MSVNSALKLKLDELFLRWITDRATQKVLRDNLIQLKSGHPIEAMLALPAGIVVGPMSASSYGYFYGPVHCESSGPNPDGLPSTGLPAPNHHSCIASPRPNTPPYFPQPPYSKICSPRSPRRHTYTSGSMSSQAVKGSGESRTNEVTHTNKVQKENGIITIHSKVAPNSESQDSETKLSSRNTSNRLVNHDVDTDDTSKTKTNKTTSLRTNDRNGSKQLTTTPSSAPAYVHSSENNKQDADMALHQQPRECHEANKHRVILLQNRLSIHLMLLMTQHHQHLNLIYLTGQIILAQFL
ncbi:unnamed protein product [Heterobilharzia americana]|nr:unnamed protein product [Heterobilharzia americana]